MTYSWFKVVTKSRIIVSKENKLHQLDLGHSIYKKKKTIFILIIIFPKVSIFPLLTDRLLSRLKFTIIAFVQKILLGFCFFFWCLAISLKRYDQEKELLELEYRQIFSGLPILTAAVAAATQCKQMYLIFLS